MKNIKAQGMPINVIVIAAISMLVLFVLLYIFSGGIGKTSQNLGSCITKGGKCANSGEGECKDKEYPIPFFVSGECEQSKPKNLCCLRAGVADNQKQTDSSNKNNPTPQPSPAPNQAPSPVLKV